MSTSGGNATGYEAIGAGLSLTTRIIGTTTTQSGNGQLTLGALLLPLGIKVVSLGLEVVTAGDAGCTVTPALYADDGTGKPGALVLAGATFAADAAGIKSAAAAATLAPGWLWAGYLVLAAPVTAPIVRASPPPVIGPLGGVFQSNPANLQQSVFQQNGLGALPAQFAGGMASSNIAILQIGT